MSNLITTQTNTATTSLKNIFSLGGTIKLAPNRLMEVSICDDYFSLPPSLKNSHMRFSKVPDGAKTLIDKDCNEGIRIISKGVWGSIYTSDIIIPHVVDVQVIQDRVVIVYFADGSKEKAVLDSADTFSLEQGISICITKKMLSMQIAGADNGSSAYNKIINHCLRIYKDNRKAEEQAVAAERVAKEKAKKAEDKARTKKKKQTNKKREREIEIQKEAYLRAMREFGGNPATND